jgi:hypothetical protein
LWSDSESNFSPENNSWGLLSWVQLEDFISVVEYQWRWRRCSFPLAAGRWQLKQREAYFCGCAGHPRCRQFECKMSSPSKNMCAVCAVYFFSLGPNSRARSQHLVHER